MEDIVDTKHKSLGEAIAKKRAEQGLSQRQLAHMIGHSSSNSYIYRVEQGQVKLSLEQLIKIADALGVKVVELVNF